MFRRFSLWMVLAALASPPFALAAEKPDKIKELQRDVAVLQDMFRQLQQSQDKKFADLQGAVQQAAESVGRANEAIAGIQSSLQQSLRSQEEKVVAPVVGLSTRMDNLSTELRTSEQNLTDMSSQLTKILAMLDDMNKAIKVIQTPPAPPPSPDPASVPQAAAPTASVAAPGVQAQPPANPGPPPGSAVDMYQNALHDYLGGNYDLALTEFADYLTYFDKTAYAPNAHYYIGMIHYAKKDFETATRDFDEVLEKYPESANKNGDARFYKGKSLLGSGKPTQAGAEFRDLILHHDHAHESRALEACQELQSLGMHCPPPPAAPVRKNSKKQ